MMGDVLFMKVCQECNKIIKKDEPYYSDGNECYLCESCHEAIMTKYREAADEELNEIYDQIGDHLYEN